MFWEILNQNGSTTIVAFIAVMAATVIGYYQYKINKSIHTVQDAIEIYAFPWVAKIYNEQIPSEPNDNPNRESSLLPQLHILNVGTRLIYIDKYVFNGRVYMTDGQVLPPTYSNSNAMYYIDLPTNGEIHVSVDIFYRDLDGRKWKSLIIAELNQTWRVKTLPRESESYN